jgi:hypothetical protein
MMHPSRILSVVIASQAIQTWGSALRLGLDRVAAARDDREQRARRPALVHEPARGDPRQGRSRERRSSRRRSGDASDADAWIAARQSAEKLAEPGWSRLNASGPLAATVAAARRKLKRSNSWRRPGDLV